MNTPIFDKTSKFDPLKQITYKFFDVEIGNFKQTGVEFPDFWSKNSIDIVTKNYFAGKLNTPTREYSIKQLISRVVDTITLWGVAQNYFGDIPLKRLIELLDKHPIELVYKSPHMYRNATNIFVTEFENVREFNYYMKHTIVYQKLAFNSPVWFNIGNQFNEQQASACFISDVEDNLESIFKNVEVEGKIFKLGSGVGTNLSKIRSSKEYITGGGKSSGVISFAKIYDSTASAIKSGGKTRRAAIMRELNIDHGDVIDFINLKTKEEKKAKALIQSGYSGSFDDADGAYGTVAFQNSNHSISIVNSFMNAVEKDEQWALVERKELDTYGHFTPENALATKSTSQGTFDSYDKDVWLLRVRTNWDSLSRAKGYIYQKVIEWHNAKDILWLIAENNWITGDPGLQFIDIINAWHTCLNSGKIRGSNPCGEYLFIDNTSCNLATINLMKFYDLVTNTFNITEFCKCAQYSIMAQDILIFPAHYPNDEIRKATNQFRTLGLNYTNLGTLLMYKGLAYDSGEARTYAAILTAAMTLSGYAMSANLASKLEPFPEFKKNAGRMRSIVNKHVEHFKTLSKFDTDTENILGYINVWLTDYFNNTSEYRNAQISVIAPTGTVSFMLGADTTALEPMFAWATIKDLVGGGVLELSSPLIGILEHLKFDPKDIEQIIRHLDKHNDLPFGKGFTMLDSKKKIFETCIGNNPIRYEAHLLMDAAIQPFVSGGISKTINLPEDATVQDIYDLYLQAYRLGIKSFTVYRNNSKYSQPLNNKTDAPKVTESATLEVAMPGVGYRSEKRHLPETRDAVNHRFSIAGHRGWLTLAKYPDSKEIGAIFIDSKEGSTIGGLLDSLAICMSIGLQHGVDPMEFIESLKNTKFEPAGITSNPDIRFTSSIVDYLVRYMQNFIEGCKKEDPELLKSCIEKEVNNNLLSTITETNINYDVCPICGNTLQKTGTCSTCKTCGFNTGCA